MCYVYQHNNSYYNNYNLCYCKYKNAQLNLNKYIHKININFIIEHPSNN